MDSTAQCGRVGIVSVSKKSTNLKPAKATTGPKPNILKIEGDWQDAVKKSLGKKMPAGGWPK